MKKVEFALLGGAAIVFVILILLIGALGVIGFVYLKTNPDTGNFNYSNYDGSTEVTIDPTASPTATPTPSPTATPSPTPTPSPTATPTATPTPDSCAVYGGKTAHGDRVCGGYGTDATIKYIFECQDGEWTYMEACTSASTCNDGVCS